MRASGVPNLLRRAAARHGLFLIISGLILGGFEFLICAIVSTLDLPTVLGGLMKTVPPNMRVLIEQQVFGGMSNAGMVAFGWSHPIALAVGAAAAIVLAARAIAGEIESGALELVLSQPISRSGYFFGYVLFSLGALLILTALGAAGTLLGETVYGLKVIDFIGLAKLALNFWLLQCAWYGIALVASVFARESGRVSFAGFLIVLVSYIVHLLGQLWPAAAWLLPYSLDNYFSPRTVLIEHALGLRPLILLAAVSVLGVAAAAWRFKTRDIP